MSSLHVTPSELSSSLVFDELLNDDLYTTYMGTWKGQPVVIKLFTEMSDSNNEFEVLVELQRRDFPSHLYPQPLFVTTEEDGYYDIIPESMWDLPSCHEDVFKIIGYTYLPGVPLLELIEDTERYVEPYKMVSDIKTQLHQLHSLGVVHGDVAARNIIRGDDGIYRLIDYGRCFSHQVTTPHFPPMEYMVMDGNISDTADDFIGLGRALSACLKLNNHQA